MMKIQIDNIVCGPEEPESGLPARVRLQYNLGDATPVTILRRSLDARRKNRVVYRYRVCVEVSDDEAGRLLVMPDIAEYRAPETLSKARPARDLSVLVVGAGPAGLFGALRLAGAGADVTIVERGRGVEERMEDIGALERDGVLNPESNVLFGEGGAEAYSDGKLTTRIRKPEIEYFLRSLIEFGAPPEIAYETRPHLGTDRLRAMLENMRSRLTERGVRILFRVKAVDLVVSSGMVRGIVTSDGNEITADAVLLATGHSARDVYGMLHRRGVALEQKGFAVGTRVEHPSELVNFMQYGRAALRHNLPPADYFLAYNDPASGLGVYTFCMCPGGEVVNSSSEHGALCVNGMSYSARDGAFSNAAVVVTVKPERLAAGPLAGVDFQRMIEERAFVLGGGNFTAPAQTVESFLGGRAAETLPAVSYRRGAAPAMLAHAFPEWIAEALKQGLAFFNTKMKGFTGPEGVLIGAETRTSSPVRILRGDDMQAPGLQGLFPAGEGAGYAGGIVSSAVDGIRAADAILAIRGGGR